ncbi:DNA polymerase III subunit delta [Rhodobacteraceae bacterium 2CG4]|uniref:DNA-directed DNA polymerase n=1 Tax=Halovulum marinum TaxID=2662447 RepID=A0A6L5Z256_9RHOB|nr:DNA polymerase III subunit delta [Halovulum marinum]MSU90661.1 DNA polymerase III subunit delta [Halovulum marinum]
MKLSPRDATRFIARPDPGRAGILFYGPDAMRIALKREDLVAALVGPRAAEEMRLTRLPGGDLRRDPAALADAVKARGFFPGQRAVLVDDATDAAAPAVAAALDDWAEGDAFVVVTAGQLKPSSALRKYFETSRTALAAPVYTDPPGRNEIEATLQKAGLSAVSPEAMRDLTDLANALDPGDFRQTVEKLALYMHGSGQDATPADVAAIAPATTDTAVDAVVGQCADGAVPALAQSMPRLAGQSIQPVAVCIALQRHFRQLHAAAAHPQGPEQGLTRMRPPVFGPRREQMLRQVRAWDRQKLEEMLAQIMDTDLALRSARPVPHWALVERLMMRIAMNRPK